MTSDEPRIDDRPADHVPLWELIEWRAGVTPEAVLAVDEHGGAITFGGFRDRCEAVAAAFAAQGVHAGERVAWMLPTWIEAFVLAGALARLGAVQVPLIPILRHKEVAFILGQTGARRLIVPGTWRGFDYPAMAREVGDTSGGDELDIVVVDPDLPSSDPSALPAWEQVRDGDGDPDPDPVRWVFYTSGTTSNPKGTLHTDRTVAACALRLDRRFRMTPHDVNGLVFPVTHIGGIGFLAGSLIYGYRHVLIEAFDTESSPAVLAREGVTVAGAGPVFWMAYVAAQRRAGDHKVFPALRALLGGGAPKPSTIHDEVQQVLGVTLATGYGSTECPALAHADVNDPDEWRRGDGRALDDVEIRIQRLDGEPAAVGEEGELLVKGPMLFHGYLDPADDAGVFTEDGFFRTSDLGRMDAHGVLKITGRLKDIIIRKGENISAKEVEDVLYRHPAVADVACIALPDSERGELCCAVIVPVDGSVAPGLDELAEHCRGEGLARQKIPERVEVVDVLPRNPTGKVLKHELQARFDRT